MRPTTDLISPSVTFPHSLTLFPRPPLHPPTHSTAKTATPTRLPHPHRPNK
ncbi:MAG: hypothetical protein LBQ31_10240 [Bacteroidales bacterium]|nr:hypothetical protein [Bacteroidales bacterium]